MRKNELSFVTNTFICFSPLSSFKGWSQFIKAAKSMNGTVITLTKFGMPIDFYTYSNNGGDAICEKVPGIQFETAGVDAVACLPKGTEFDYETLRGRKWTKQAKKLGSVATFNSLVHNTGVATSGSGTPKAGTPTSIGGGIPTSLDVPSYPVDDSTVAVTVALPEEPKDGYPSAMEAPNPEGGACYLGMSNIEEESGLLACSILCHSHFSFIVIHYSL